MIFRNISMKLVFRKSNDVIITNIKIKNKNKSLHQHRKVQIKNEQIEQVPESVLIVHSLYEFVFFIY